MRDLLIILPMIIGLSCRKEGLVKHTQQLGVLYNATSFSNLAGYTITGSTASWTAGTTLNTVNGTSSQADYLRWDGYITCLERWDLETRFVINSTATGANRGIAFGIKAVVGGRDFLCHFVCNDQSDNGKIKLWAGATLMSTSPNALIYSVGDEVRLLVNRAKNVVSVVVQNVTQSTSMSHTFTYSYTGSTTSVVHVTGKFAIWSMGGDFNISKHVMSSTQSKNIKVCVIGDSITYGFFTNNSRWADLIDPGNAINFCVSAGGGEIIQRAQDRLAELKTLNADYYLLMIGGNNVQFGNSYNPEYKDLRNSLAAADNAYGKDVAVVVHCYATPRDNFDMTALNAFIQSVADQYGDPVVVNTFNSLKGSGFDLAAAYDSGDSVHPNTAAQTIIKNEILTVAPYLVP